MIKRTRLAFEDHFTQVPNAWLRDTRLSRRARGLLAELLSHREGWEVTLESLVESGPEGRDAIRAGVAELEQHGYLVRERQRSGGGHFTGVTYLLHDPMETSIGKPYAGETNVGESAGKKTISQEDQVLPFGKEEHKGRVTRAATTVPVDLTLTPDMLAWAGDRFPGIDLDVETEKFRNYYTSTGKKHKDWIAAWRNWILKEDQYRKQRRAVVQQMAPRANWHPAQATDPYAGLSDDELFG